VLCSSIVCTCVSNTNSASVLPAVNQHERCHPAHSGTWGCAPSAAPPSRPSPCFARAPATRRTKSTAPLCHRYCVTLTDSIWPPPLHLPHRDLGRMFTHQQLKHYCHNCCC
jgi:hypothetical protein